MITSQGSISINLRAGEIDFDGVCATYGFPSKADLDEAIAFAGFPRGQQVVIDNPFTAGPRLGRKWVVHECDRWAETVQRCALRLR